MGLSSPYRPAEGLLTMDDSGAEDWSPRGGTGGGRDARTERGALRRRLSEGAASTARAVRAVPVGVVVAGLVMLAGTAVVLQLAGAWPFERPDVASRSVPGARLPLPPSAVEPGRSPSDRQSGGGGGEDRDDRDERTERGDQEGKGAAGGAGDEGGQAMSTLPPSGQGMAGRDDGTGHCECRASWHVDAQWEDFNATVRVTTTAGAAVRGWQITWKWPDGQRLVKGWNGEFRESGAGVTVRNGPGNAEISAGGEATFGFQATGRGSPAPRLTCRVL